MNEADSSNIALRNVLNSELIVRFWPKVNKLGPDDCWLWLAGQSGTGYGLFHVGNRKMRKAHRISWMIHARQHIPSGLLVCHKCDTPLCVNPDHLFLGTHKDNRLDCARKHRHCHGIKQRCAKLTDATVTELRKRYSAGGETLKSLGREYGVNMSTVGYILRRNTWAHIP